VNSALPIYRAADKPGLWRTRTDTIAKDSDPHVCYPISLPWSVRRNACDKTVAPGDDFCFRTISVSGHPLFPEAPISGHPLFP